MLRLPTDDGEVFGVCLIVMLLGAVGLPMALFYVLEVLDWWEDRKKRKKGYHKS